MLQQRRDWSHSFSLTPHSLPRRMNMTKVASYLVPLAVALATTGLMFAATVA
jgi:hypothetical protein